MGKGRLEAFSDGVLAVIITIMVLDLRAPHSENIGALRPLLPTFLSYVLSFIFIGIYWNNHHHLFHAIQHVDGRILWANLYLLFWLSLVPFTTDWIGESRLGVEAVAVYGFVLLMASIAFTILVRALIAHHGKNSTLAKAIGRDRKGNVSILLYVIGILTTFIRPWFGIIAYVIVALIWFIPDRRITKHLASDHPPHA
jgi:uncharacterized membrane protein